MSATVAVEAMHHPFCVGPDSFTTIICSCLSCISFSACNFCELIFGAGGFTSYDLLATFQNDPKGT